MSVRSDHNDHEPGYGTAVFWGITAIGAVGLGVIVAILSGFLLGHYTHVRTRTVAERTITRTVPGAGVRSSTSALTVAAPVNLPSALPATTSIGAGLQGVSGLKATVWGQGPKDTGDITAGPSGSLFVSTAGETGKPVDGVWLVRQGKPPVRVIGGLVTALGLVWHDNQLYVSSFGRVDVYSHFTGRRFLQHRALLTGLPGGKLGFNDDLRLGPDGRFYMGIGSPCDHCLPPRSLSATIVSFNPNGSDLSVFAYGVRGNSSLAFRPGTDELFMATNQRNAAGKAPTPPDEFDMVPAGSDWGYPSCWQQGGAVCQGVSRPLVNIDSHSAADGLTFVNGQWGASYGESAFVSEWALGKVIRIGLTEHDNVLSAHPQVILTDVKNPGPLVTMPDGSLLVSSYATGTLYAVRPGTASTTAAAPPAATTTTAAPSASAPGAIPISASAGGMLMFNTKTLTAKAGTDTFEFTNKSSVPHNFTIMKGSKVIGATPTFAGGAKALTVKLAAGTYTFLCTVPGHAAAGMKGTLTVTAGSAAKPTTKKAPSASASAPGAIPVSASASGMLMFNTKTLTAKAGTDTFEFTNKSSVPHNFTIMKGSKVSGATPTFAGGAKALTVKLAAGTYTFECTVPGHAAAGMKGTLTVS